MKVHALQNPIERSGFSQESQFSIKATAHSFEILSSGLYSNKPLAILRELSCNARDGHMAKGNLDQPFEIKLPNNLDSTFYIKDFGIGLSEFDMCGGYRHVETGEEMLMEEVANIYNTEAEAMADGFEKVGGIYNTYFESTKTMSDDFIGQLGLGSKSPFSYTDSFTVESRFNGTKSIYTCFKNEDGFPSIAKMSECASDEPTGITVSMSVKSGDFSAFEVACKQAIMYFDVQPNVIGAGRFEPYTFEYISRNDEWAIRKNNNYWAPAGMYVVQGGVAYPVDVDVVTKDHPHLSGLARLDCNLFMPIGSVDVAASREALQYKARTVSNIIVILEKMVAQLLVDLQGQLDACTTEWDRIITFKKLKSSSGGNFNKLFEAHLGAKLKDLDGNPIKASLAITPNPIMIVTLYANGRYGGSATASRDVIKNIVPDEGTRIVVYPKVKGAKALVNAIMDQAGGKVVYVIHPVETVLFDQTIVDQIIAEMGHPEVFDHSKIVMPTRTSTYVKRNKEEKLVWSGYPEGKDTFSRLCWDRENFDLLDDESASVFAPIDRFSVVPEITNKDYDFEKLMDIADEMGYSQQIVGLVRKDVAIVQQNPEWIEIDACISMKLKKSNANDAIFKCFGAKDAIATIGADRLSSFLKFVTSQESYITNKAFLEVVEPLKLLSSISNKFKNNVAHVIPTNLLDIHSGRKQYCEQYVQHWNDMFAMAPMLNCIDWDRLRSNYELYQYVYDYINEHSPVDEIAVV